MLAWREREVATLVYERGSATAKELETQVRKPLSNGAIRSMLNRLVKKGILKRRASGRHKEFTYIAALANDDVKRRALKQLADDYFGGSFLTASMMMVDLITTDRQVAIEFLTELEGRARLSHENTVELAA